MEIRINKSDHTKLTIYSSYCILPTSMNIGRKNEMKKEVVVITQVDY